MSCECIEKQTIGGTVTIERLNDEATQFLFKYWVQGYEDLIVASEVINYLGRPVPTRYQELLNKYDDETQWLLEDIQQLLIDRAQAEEAEIIGIDLQIQKAYEDIQKLVKKTKRIEAKVSNANRKNLVRYLKRCEMHFKRFYDRLLTWQLKHLVKAETIPVTFAQVKKANDQYLSVLEKGY